MKTLSWILILSLLSSQSSAALADAVLPPSDEVSTNQALNEIRQCKSNNSCESSGWDWHKYCNSIKGGAAQHINTYCASNETLESGIQKSKDTAIAYWVATGLCASACAASFAKATGIGTAVSAALDIACTGGGIAATVADFYASSQLQIEGDATTAALVQYAPGSIAALGTVTQGVNAALHAKAFVKDGTTQMTTTTTKEGTKEATKKNKIACAIAIVYGALGAYKQFGAPSIFNSNIDTNTASILAEIDTMLTLQNSGAAERPTYGGGGLTARTSGFGAAKGYKANAGGVEDSAYSPTREQISAAMAEDALLKNIPDRDKILDGFQKAFNMSPEDFGKKANSGSGSLGSLMAGLASGLPAGMTAAFDEIEKNAKEGKIRFQGDAASSTYQSGGKGSAGSGDSKLDFSSFMEFGKKPGGAGKGGTTEFNFSPAAKQSLDSQNGDIWHSTWKGSLFQIVSLTIDRFRDNVVSLEWSTPLNRALLGLPPLKKDLQVPELKKANLDKNPK